MSVNRRSFLSFLGLGIAAPVIATVAAPAAAEADVFVSGVTKINAGALQTAEIMPLHIASTQIVAAKIAANAITAEKIAVGCIPMMQCIDGQWYSGAITKDGFVKHHAIHR